MSIGETDKSSSEWGVNINGSAFRGAAGEVCIVRQDSFTVTPSDCRAHVTLTCVGERTRVVMGTIHVTPDVLFRLPTRAGERSKYVSQRLSAFVRQNGASTDFDFDLQFPL